MSVRSISPLPELRIYVTPMPLPRGKVPALGGKSQSIVDGYNNNTSIEGSMDLLVQIYYRLCSCTGSTSLGHITTCRQLQPP